MRSGLEIEKGKKERQDNMQMQGKRYKEDKTNRSKEKLNMINRKERNKDRTKY